MTLTIKGTITEILCQLYGLETYYGKEELVCTVIKNENTCGDDYEK